MQQQRRQISISAVVNSALQTLQRYNQLESNATKIIYLPLNLQEDHLGNYINSYVNRV
jgi:hypothetical protein